MPRRVALALAILLLAGTGLAHAEPAQADCDIDADEPRAGCEGGVDQDASHRESYDQGPVNLLDAKQYTEQEVDRGIDMGRQLRDPLAASSSRRSAPHVGSPVDTFDAAEVLVAAAMDRVITERGPVDCPHPSEADTYRDRMGDEVHATSRVVVSLAPLLEGGVRETEETWRYSCDQVEETTGYHFDGSSAVSVPSVASATGYDVDPAPTRRQTAADAAPAEVAASEAIGGGATVAGPDVDVGWSILLGVAVLVPAAALLWLYRRVRGDELLDHELRRRMVEIVREEPAVNTSEIAEKLGVDVTTVLYHARRLDDADLVVTKRCNGEVVFFDPTRHPKAMRGVAAAIRHETKRRLVDLVAREPGLNLSEAARCLDRAPSTIKRHADGLVEEGVLEDVDDGAARRLTVAEDAREALDRLAG